MDKFRFEGEISITFFKYFVSLNIIIYEMETEKGRASHRGGAHISVRGTAGLPPKPDGNRPAYGGAKEWGLPVFRKRDSEKMEIDRFTGGILPRVKLPDSEKMVIDRLWRDPERRVRPFSEQDFRLYYPEGKDMRKTTDSAGKVRSVIGGKSGQSYF
nr:hypothetical protein [Bacillaceae bacterium]